VAITADYQGNIRSTTFGASTNYPIYTSGIAGLGIPAVRNVAAPRGFGHGSASGLERLQPRTIRIPFKLTASTAAAVQGYVDALKAAFGPSDSELELTLRIPGTPDTVMSYFGRPRPLTVKQSLLAVGVSDVLASFDALDPLAYGAAETDDNNSGSFTVTNSGDAVSDRCTITITSTAAKPTIKNGTAAGDPTITWGTTLSNGTVRVIDLRAGTVATAGGVDKTDELLNASSRFWSLESGGNSIVTTNISDADFSFRSAWY